jgi:hypothetical protein
MTEELYAILHTRSSLLRLTCAGIAQSKQGAMIYFELIARDPQSINAFRANIYKNRRTTQLVSTDIKVFDPKGEERIVRVIPKTKYHLLNTNHHYVIMHEGFDKLHMNYLLGGDDETPSPWFQYAVQNFISVPFLSQWTQELWQAAVAESLVEKLSAQGVTAWRLYRRGDDWQELILSLRKDGGLRNG